MAIPFGLPGNEHLHNTGMHGRHAAPAWREMDPAFPDVHQVTAVGMDLEGRRLLERLPKFIALVLGEHRRAVQHHAGCPLRYPHGNFGGDRCAGVMSKPGALVQMQMVQHGQHGIRIVLDAGDLSRQVRHTKPRRVHTNGPDAALGQPVVHHPEHV